MCVDRRDLTVLWTLGPGHCFGHSPTLLRYAPPPPRPPSAFHSPHSTPTVVVDLPAASGSRVRHRGFVSLPGEKPSRRLWARLAMRTSSGGHCLPRARAPPCPAPSVGPPSLPHTRSSKALTAQCRSLYLQRMVFRPRERTHPSQHRQGPKLYCRKRTFPFGARPPGSPSGVPGPAGSWGFLLARFVCIDSSL